MRFAYIDSNGNEVPIPSVDALALRIELGAITENTQLYDAQADEWGPAHTHEIFHTLSRDAGGDEGFVAPPPVAPPSVSTPTPGTASGEEAAGGETTSAAASGPDATAEEDALAPSSAETAGGEPETASVSAAEEPEDEDGSFGLTLAEAPEEDGGGAEGGDDSELGLTVSEDPAVELALPGDEDALDLAPPAEDALDLAAPFEEEAMDLSPGGGEDEGATFDFGGMEGGLELEETFDPPTDEPMDLSAAVEGGDDLSGGMELETSMEFDTDGFDVGEGSSLDLEAPMSEFSPEQPPSWMEEDEAASDGVLDFSSVSAAAGEDEVEGEVPLRDRRTPRNKPSPPKHRKQRNLALPIVLVVLLLAVGMGGYAAWPLISERLASGGEPEVPEVYLPPLSEELMPVMRDASADALAASFEDARSAWAQTGPLQEPPSEWLEGIYLANAGDYETVEAFWSGMADFAGRVRAIDLAAFDAALSAELQSRSMVADQMSAVRERADSGFVAATPERTEVYDRFDALIDASLALHSFLVANQDQIEYAPAAAVTTDPVLEVNPATPAIGEAMGDLLDDVLASLNELEALGGADGVTAEGLRSALRVRIQEVGVR